MIVFFAIMCGGPAATAATFNVSDAAGLRAALLAAGTNGQDDLVVLAAGTYLTGGTPFTFATNENKTLALQGASGTNRSQVVLDGGGTSQVLSLGCAGSCGSITLTGLTVQGGKSSIDGGGVRSSADLILSDVNFIGNSANSDPGYSGGAIYAPSVAVANSTFSNNIAGYGGGAIFGATGAISVSSSNFYSNTANTGGAVSASSGFVTVTNSTFTNNASKSGGGAIYTSNGIAVTNSNFSFNQATQATSGGGAIFATLTLGRVTNSIFTNNTAGSNGGGAIYGTSIDTINSIFSGNSATGTGGAILGSGYVVNSSFSGNSASSGAAIVVGYFARSVINSVFYGHSTPAISAGYTYNLYNNLIDTSADTVGFGPILSGNVAPGATSPFVDGANSNFRLSPGSLAIDTGLDPNSTTFANLLGAAVGGIRQALMLDIDGNPRPSLGTAVDMGAYEFSGPPTVPGAPTTVSATGGNAAITIGFGAPATNGGSAITGYSAACTSSNGGVSGSNTGGANSTSIQMSGLTNGKTYTCTVSASNSIGTGPTSTAPYNITPGAVPLLLDVDGNGTPDALTDGLLLIRYLFGLRGDALIAGAIGVGATRTSAAEIQAYIESLRP